MRRDSIVTLYHAQRKNGEREFTFAKHILKNVRITKRDGINTDYADIKREDRVVIRIWGFHNVPISIGDKIALYEVEDDTMPYDVYDVKNVRENKCSSRCLSHRRIDI